MNVSFAGCGFLGIYHIGVASCFREYAPNVLVNKIAGASVGSLAAVALICGVPLGQTTTDVLRVAVKARSRALGPLHPGFDLNSIIREGLDKALPENAHILCSGRLFISCTRIPDGKNVLLSQFNSREDLIQALLCSCFIPLYSGLRFPKANGEILVDGGFSDNLPVLDENTITISPFAGEHDICPEDESCNLLQINLVNTSISICPGNIYRFSRILFPPHPEVLNKMCQQGFDDALKYLQRTNLISCMRCMAVQSVLTLSDVCTDKSSSTAACDGEHVYDNCIDCRYRRQLALLDSLPDAIVIAIQDACDQVNKGVINWLFRHRPIKLLSLLGIPYVLPFDISVLIFCKVWQALPKLQTEIRAKFNSIIVLIKSFLHNLDNNRHLYSAKFSCQLAITEFDYTEESVSSSYAIPSVENIPHDTCQTIKEHTEPPARDRTRLQLPDLVAPKPKRQSYAGLLNVTKEQNNAEAQRRKSMCDIRQPERILRNMKFGFTMDLATSVNANKKQSMVDTFQSLGEEDTEIDVIEITNKALNWERDCIDKYHTTGVDPEKTEALGILDVTTNGPVMAYYYMDDDRTVKVTEVYNVDDANTSAVLPEEERETNNKLQWENEWVSNPDITRCDIPTLCVSDTLDDHEFDMSDGDCEPKETDDLFKELKDRRKSLPARSPDFVRTNVPKRKASFIFVK